jgi:acyl-CoA synthetase (AMP-forming)/AMP-acid ligase II
MNKGQLFPLLERAARTWPSDIAIVKGNSSFTFLQLKTAAETLASKLLAAGIESGYKIGLLCSNGPEYVVGSFALFLVHGVVVPIFPGLKKSEVEELAGAMELDGYCYSPPYESQVPGFDEKGSSRANLGGELEFHIQLANQQNRPEADRKLLRLGAPLLRFTSGTTSQSKGVIIPQSSMLEYTNRFISVYSIERGDRILNLLSMAHIFYQVTTGLLQGVKILIEEATRIDAIIDMIREHRVTHIEAAPTFYSMLLAYEKASPDDFRRVRYLTSCGAPLADNVAVAFRERFGREIVQRYGLTETGPVLVNLSEDASKRGSLGTAAPGCEIRLDNRNSSCADVGEIIARCPGLFAGYYRPWMPKEKLLEGGWFHTGDLGRCDKDGYYWLVGRTKTVINVGAVKVFPDEIEDVLLTHPAIEEAVVFGAPDLRFGEAPHAKVKLASGSNCTQRELLRYANKNLSLFKALRRIEFVDAIPKTVTGKTKRYEGTLRRG